jgi:tetratricopeptide (TPR) repeat protein
MKAKGAGSWLAWAVLLALSGGLAGAGLQAAQKTGRAQALPLQGKPTGETPALQEEKKAPDYSQEPFVFEQFHIRARFEKDGTGRREMTVRVRVQSEAGVQQLGQLIFGYNSANEKLEFSYVRVRKADGSVVSASAGDIQDLSAPIAREAPVYTDFRQKHVTVPGLRPGETLEYQTVTDVHTPLAPGHFWLEHSFVDRVIVLDEQLEVNVPKESTVKLKTKPEAEPAVREDKDRGIYLWKHANLERPEEDEEGAPKKKKKSRKPEAPDIQLTTFQNWEDVGKWYAGLERVRVAPDEAIRAKAAELIRGRESERDKVEALYRYVAQNFRYVSLSFGVGRYQPHAASEVFSNQYGDCKDKHTLLAAMLEAAGLHAWPVLINSSRKIDPEVPSPSQFDHVISAVPLGSDLLWLDTTTEVAPFRLLAASLRNKQALLVPAEGAPRLVETPADPPFPATQRVEIEGQVSELGKLTARVRYTMRGDGELILRSAFRRTPKNQWKQLAQIVAYSDGIRGEVTDVTTSDPTATEEPFRMEYHVAQANFLDWSSKKSKMNLPLPALGLPQADDDAEEDDEPIELGTPVDITTTLKLELPAKYAARAPISVAVSRDYAEYRSSYKLEGGVLTAERKLAFRMRELPPARARDYLAFVRALRNDEGQTVSVETTVAGTPTIPESAKADELFQAAGAAFGSENIALATELLKRVLELEPKHKTAWGVLGLAYFSRQDFGHAVEAFQKQVESNPYDENAYNLLGMTYWRQQKYEEAAGAFRKQLEVNPLHKNAQGNLGRMLVEWRKYEEAVPELEKSISLEPDDASLHVSLGRAYLNQNEPDKALAAFDKAVELSPEPVTWNNIAYYLTLSGMRLERAQQYAESAVAAVSAELRNVHLDRLTTRDLQRVSSIAAYWDTLGWVHFQKGDLTKAERYVKAAWTLDQHGEVGDHLGQIYEKQGRRPEALRTYSAAMRAVRPIPETKERRDKLNAGREEAFSLMAMGMREYDDLRVVRLGKVAAGIPKITEDAQAEFYLVFVPQAGKKGVGARVEEVKFVKGDERLQALAATLRKAAYPVYFPEDTPTRIIRRGELHCDAGTKMCQIVLKPAESVTTVN